MPLWHHIPALCLDFVWNMETKMGKCGTPVCNQGKNIRNTDIMLVSLE
jgi:hypothetical protein